MHTRLKVDVPAVGFHFAAAGIAGVGAGFERHAGLEVAGFVAEEVFGLARILQAGADGEGATRARASGRRLLRSSLLPANSAQSPVGPTRWSAADARPHRAFRLTLGGAAPVACDVWRRRQAGSPHEPICPFR